MAKLRDVSGLQVSQDLDFERRTFRFERLVWAAVAVALVAAGLGLLGGIGPLTASSRAPAEGGLKVGYDRFVRVGSPVQLDVELDGGAGIREIAVARDWLDKYRIDGYLPEPDAVTAAPDRYVFTFDVDPAGLVRLSLTPQQAGLHDAVVWGPAGRRVEFSQLVYP